MKIYAQKSTVTLYIIISPFAPKNRVNLISKKKNSESVNVYIQNSKTQGLQLHLKAHLINHVTMEVHKITASCHHPLHHHPYFA